MSKAPDANGWRAHLDLAHAARPCGAKRRDGDSCRSACNAGEQRRRWRHPGSAQSYGAPRPKEKGGRSRPKAVRVLPHNNKEELPLVRPSCTERQLLTARPSPAYSHEVVAGICLAPGNQLGLLAIPLRRVGFIGPQDVQRAR
jgi:hypothetical protein